MRSIERQDFQRMTCLEKRKGTLKVKGKQTAGLVTRAGEWCQWEVMSMNRETVLWWLTHLRVVELRRRQVAGLLQRQGKALSGLL